METIYQRIHAIQKEVDYVKKDAKISMGSGSYTAVSHDKVLDALRAQLVAKKIIVVPQQRSLGEVLVTGHTNGGKAWVLFRALYDIHYICADNKEDFLTVTVEGHGEDTNDKADGKALSYACKSANLKLFLLATGDNDEARMEHDVMTPVDFKQLKTRIKSAIKTMKKIDDITENYMAEKPLIDRLDALEKEEVVAMYADKKAEIQAS